MENSKLSKDFRSLQQPIDLDCVRSKCAYNNACCRIDVPLTENDKEVIRRAIPKIIHLVPLDLEHWFEHDSFCKLDGTLRQFSKDGLVRCAFFQDEKCLLEPHNAQPIQCRSFPVLIDEYNVLRLSRSNIPCLNAQSYLFSWKDVPGNDNERLIRFLLHKYNIEWVKTAKIEKTYNNPDPFQWHEGQIIKLTNEKNFLSLRQDLKTNSKPIIKLEIDDGRTDEFIMKNENGMDNVYDYSIPAYIILEKEISLLTSHDKDYYTKLVMEFTRSQAEDYFPPVKKYITPLSPKDQHLFIIANRIKITNADEVAEQVNDLYSLDDEILEKIYNKFKSGLTTDADEGFIFMFHKNLIDPIIYNLISNKLIKSPS